MNDQPAAYMVTEGIPDLPAGPEEMAMMAAQQQPVPGTPMTFQPPVQNPMQTNTVGMGMNDGVPLFELVPRRRPDGTFDNVEFVSILTPGDPKSIPRHKVTDLHRRKYAYHYSLWKQGLQTSPQGSPLEMWPVLTPAQVHALKAINIFTVEQLSAVADANLDAIPMGSTLRQQARDWLQSKEDADLLAQRTRENELLKAGQDNLQKQIAELSARLEAFTHADPKQVAPASDVPAPVQPQLAATGQQQPGPADHDDDESVPVPAGSKPPSKPGRNRK